MRTLKFLYGILARIMIGFLVFIPYATLFILSGILSFLFAVIGFASLSQLFNPIIWTTSLFELLEVMVLRHLRGTIPLPIYRGMVEDNLGREYAFMLKGPLNLGNLVLGHHVGLWENGVVDFLLSKAEMT